MTTTHSSTTPNADPAHRHTIHPIGTAAGAASGAVAAGALTGLALGAVAGPLGAGLGAAVAAAIGGLAGGYAGNVAAESVNPTTEEDYWRLHFASRQYAVPGCDYECFREAYAFGAKMRLEHPEQHFSECTPLLKDVWAGMPISQKLPWERAHEAICDAWDHVSPHDRDL